MGYIINLNKKRKIKAQLEKDKKSSENRIKFGRTKNEKQIDRQDKECNKRYLDGHKLESKPD